MESSDQSKAVRPVVLTLVSQRALQATRASRGGPGEAGAVAGGAPQVVHALQPPMPGGNALPRPSGHAALEL